MRLSLIALLLLAGVATAKERWLPPVDEPLHAIDVDTSALVSETLVSRRSARRALNEAIEKGLLAQISSDAKVQWCVTAASLEETSPP